MSDLLKITVTVNGTQHERAVEPRLRTDSECRRAGKTVGRILMGR